MISTRSVGLLIDTVVCLTLAKWETVSGRFGGYLNVRTEPRREWTAVQFLALAGFRNVYLPRLREQRIRNGRRIAVLAPLFPSYLFVAVERGDGGPRVGA
jgi:hypothetical protein